jgi:hypothetical protein
MGTTDSSPASPRARRAYSDDPNPMRAVAELAEQLEASEASGVFLFCGGQYELGALGAAIEKGIRAPVAACTGAGQIGKSGFERGGITGVSLSSSDLSMRPLLLSPLSLCQSQAVSLAREQARRYAADPGARSFGVLLVDGLSLWEEYVASALYEALGNVPVVGGSVPPGPHHPHPAVYHAGRFSRGAAVLALFETRGLAFETFVTQHFVPSQTKLVITLADPDRRLVYEINGEPAARAYAHALGIEREQLGARDFACHPLVLDMGDQLLPRAIRGHHPDQSLSMACAVEEGLVVSIAKSTDPLAALERSFAAVERRVPAPAACLVFDSLFRRIELEAHGLDSQVGELLARKGAVGFSSYGEQLGPLHLNHTLTGLALGGPSARTTL